MLVDGVSAMDVDVVEAHRADLANVGIVGHEAHEVGAAAVFPLSGAGLAAAGIVAFDDLTGARTPLCCAHGA